MEKNSINFEDVVTALDDSKKLHYLLQAYAPKNSEEQAQLWTIKQALTAKITDIDVNAYAESDEGLCSQILQVLDQINNMTIGGRTVHDINDDILNAADQDGYNFFWEFGGYWDEVELPEYIAGLFDRYYAWLAPRVDGMIYSPSTSKLSPKTGNSAISLYDLSDTELLFETEGDAERFQNLHGVEPYEMIICISEEQNIWQVI